MSPHDACVAPGTLSPEDLLAWAEGESGPAVQAHLAGCPSCRDSALAYARQNALLRARLDRADCPSPLQLGEYALDLLDEAQRSAVAAHTLLCASCAAELAQLRDDLHEPVPATTPAGTGRWALPRLIATLWTPQPGLNAAAVRGGAQLTTATYVAGDVQISLSVQPDEPPAWMLLGLVIPSPGPWRDAGEGQDAATPSTVELREGDVVVAQAGVDGLGNFVCAPVASGVYEATLHLPDKTVVIPHLEVGTP